MESDEERQHREEEAMLRREAEEAARIKREAENKALGKLLRYNRRKPK